MRRGFSTLELMIAMAIMITVLSAVVVVSFGSQSFLATSQTNAEAMNKAQELLETEQAQARKDFNLVNSIASTTDGIYEKAVYVTLMSDFLTKEVKALISWKDERMMTRTLELTTLIANFDTPVGANTCNSTLSGNWQTPLLESTVDFSALSGIPEGTYTLSDVDAYRGKLYVTASNTSAPTHPTFFIFDITDPASPSFLGAVDNEGAGGTVSAGLNAVRVAQDPASSPLKTYAFAANAYNANYTTCDPVTNTACGQLAVFDVSAPSSPVLRTNLMLASSSEPFVKGPQASAASVFYRNGYVLLGLNAAGTGNGPELHILDVHNQNLTSLISSASHILYPLGSLAVGNTVNAIAMRGTFLYVVTPNTQELQIASSSNPTNPVLVGSFNSPSGAGNGKSLAVVGDEVYMGVTVPNVGSDFHILNNTNPQTTLPESVSLDTPSSVNAIIVRDYLSFLLTNSDLRIYKRDTPTSMSAWGTVPQLVLPVSGSATEPSMDCEGNRLYITSNDGTGRGSLFVIKPGP